MNNEIDKHLEHFKNKDIDEELQKAYKNAEEFSIIPLLKLIYLTTKIDLYKEFKLQCKLSSKKSKELKSGEILLENINKKIKVYLDIVDKNYNLTNSINDCKLLSENIYELNNEPNENLKKQIISIITFLTQSIKVVFDSLKNKYQELTEYDLMLSDNTTIYLDYDLDLRIGVKFEEIIE
jgi:hypothetical protein